MPEFKSCHTCLFCSPDSHVEGNQRKHLLHIWGLLKISTSLDLLSRKILHLVCLMVDVSWRCLNVVNGVERRPLWLINQPTNQGGYCLKSLAECTALTLRTLLDDPCPQLAPIDPPLERSVMKWNVCNYVIWNEK